MEIWHLYLSRTIMNINNRGSSVKMTKNGTFQEQISEVKLDDCEQDMGWWLFWNLFSK